MIRCGCCDKKFEEISHFRDHIETLDHYERAISELRRDDSVWRIMLPLARDIYFRRLEMLGCP